MNFDPEYVNAVKQRFGIIGNHEELNRCIAIAIKVASTDISVLITGESGTGKEAFSKIIHHLSQRKHAGFIAINSGAIPAGTIDSELFGHEKGAFTSAHDARKGYFQTVDGGTIFLDEIGELPLETQSRLLRVLESGEFMRVGSSKVLKTNVRIVAATNRDLLKEIEKGKFREDLYYRLSTVNIHLPSLQKRSEDIALLFKKFAIDFADKYQVPPVELSEGAEQVLKAYRWPGNIRQLRNIVEQISILEPDRLISATTMERFLPEEKGQGLIYSEHKDRSRKEEQHHSGNDLIYSTLFEVKHDLRELKNAIQQMVQFLHFNGKNYPDSQYSSPPKLLGGSSTNPVAEDFSAHVPTEEQGHADSSHLEERSQQAESETLSLEENEKTLISMALEKYNGKRKAAAKELGVSERTLYRKIKQYDLE